MNAFVERRMLTVMNATRASLKAASMPLRFWSYAALDAIDKANFLPVYREGKLHPSPHQLLQNSGLDVSAIARPDSFLPFGQVGFATNTSPTKKKLDSRATEARYLRRMPNNLYQVWLEKENKITLVRTPEFILKDRPDNPLQKQQHVPQAPQQHGHSTDLAQKHKSAEKSTPPKLSASQADTDHHSEHRWLLHPANRFHRCRQVLGRRMKPVVKEKTTTQKRNELVLLLPVIKDAKRDMGSTPTQCHSSDEILPE
eukprot:Plantae.Rhodophyta-Palmaria_palmata.ctg26220.p1 GENE.Plantae.Rhodophyta-Palmaria_palmata.ctg26220~~Plantae.Rhodophyta-Palmaria_palmata.ctg26220.p1  ORF type:complete len:276 (-),score=3.21 Plantae.Rhodophyta-Palmaria_palmata.ctg26220:112-879(-)